MKIKNTTISICLLILVIVMNGCSQNVTFQKSSNVPAAEVDVKIDQDRNNNYNIELKVQNLARPQDLIPARSCYVVWINSGRGSFNIGQLVVDKNLRGSLSATTPYKPVLIKITAEDDPQATQPGRQVALISEEIEIK